ncbi:MAG: hypothetical protein IT200_14090 [Thermoleophilia bacterium]|nr:hypothetical protein [Thermoleophilia bacterium]
MDLDEVLKWAEELADALTQDMRWESNDFSRGFWTSDPKNRSRILARATAALDFLERFAGPDSTWTKSAYSTLASKGDNQSMETGARGIGDILLEWAAQVRAGRLEPQAFESQGVRRVASIDLMEQVRLLNSDQAVSPAAPIVLAGAALETALRAMVEERGLDVSGQPGISRYAGVLKAAGLLTKQDMKDVEQMAGLRNAAAHGDHESLSRERAGLMEQQVNLFLAGLDGVSSEQAGG